MNHLRQIFLTTIAVLVLITAPISAADQTAAKPLDNQAVIDMHEAELSAEVVIGAIQGASETDFDLTPKGLISLSRAGLPKEIILSM